MQQTLAFNKQYLQLTSLTSLTSSKLLVQQQQLAQLFISHRVSLYARIVNNKLSQQQFNTLTSFHSDQIYEPAFKQYSLILEALSYIFLTHFLSEITPDQQSQIKTKLVYLPSLSSILKWKSFLLVEDDPYQAISILELYTKRILVKPMEYEDYLQQLLALFKFHARIAPKILSNNQLNNRVKVLKKLFFILCHKLIHYSNNNLKLPYSRILQLYLDLFTIANTPFLSHKLVICLVYNILKIIIAIPHHPFQKQFSPLFSYFQLPLPKTYQYLILCLFHIINLLIQQKQKSYLEQKISASTKQKTLLWRQLYIYPNINFTELINKLSHAVKSIIVYRIPSLLSLISTKLQLRNLTKEFIEKLFDSPFNGDILTIKLCIEMFNHQQFTKLYQLAQNVLSSPNAKQLTESQVLIAMCSITTGVLMDNRQQGLAYAKLNHHLFQKGQRQNFNILSQQTLIEHVGFAYYNLARHSLYIDNKITYFAKALQNFLRSYEINPLNYLLSYSIGKTYLENYDYENAYKFSKLACQHNKDNWQPFALLACVYMCQKRSHKADLIIKELVNRHTMCGTLYYIKAYCEVYKLLQEVNHNEEVQASKFLGDEYYENFKQNYLRNKQSKEVTHILALLQNYFKFDVERMSTMTQYDENYFSKLRIPSQIYQESIQRYLKGLRNVFGLLLHIDQIPICQILVKKMQQLCKDKKDLDSKYYKALLHENKKQHTQALEQCNQIIQYDPYHPDALIKLALLEPVATKANEYIQLASKFRDDDQFNFAKGMVLSRSGEYELAHSYFLNENRTCWLEMMPDFMYYY